MGTFLYPTNAELTAILQEKLPVRTLDDAIFEIMPIEDDDASLVMWEQEDNYVGLMSLRGFDGQPSRVSRVGIKQYQMLPGVYGDYIQLDETELTLGRATGSFGQPIDIQNLVVRRQDQLLNRAIDRLRYIGWTLVAEGTFSVPTPDGQVIHSDSFTLQSYAASVAWTTSATATPLKDFRSVRLLGRGKGVAFGAGSVAYMSQVTFNSLVSNTNANDIAGRRVTGLLAPLNLEEVNQIMLGEALPTVQIYDEGYLADDGSFVPFLPDGRVVVVGKRPAGQRVAAFKMTRNATNPNASPGMYNKVIDRGEDSVPRLIEVHMGFNGGPAIYYPSAIVKMSV
ncbi:MAG: major capsid protein [Fimbriimonas ginsengisoli]|uniref:Major capsid protein n=1 Tax=Fimbriimonas ginsengisoli TaxID=1005039 RepID=A0A931PU56_FIMGI|nr:major capsid protein [Fimbriimonas ginsengisoli]